MPNGPDEHNPAATVTVALAGGTCAEPAWLPERYGFVRAIAVTGMSQVVEVHDTKLDRHVALKLALAPDEDPERLHLFSLQAGLAARLQHPHIVPVYDSDVLPDGRPYFTMPLVEGLSLRERTPRDGHDNRDTWARMKLVDAVRAVASAVDAAHQLGVLHRDIKPDNIVTGDNGSVVLFDWGISRIFRGDASRSPGVAGQLTPGWGAPEQVRGDLAAEGPETDVWALGLCLYWVLSGVAPPRVLVLERFPSKVLDRVNWRADPTVAPLVQVVLRCVREPGAGRPPTAAELAAELQVWLDGRLRTEQADTRVVHAQRSLQAFADLRALAARLDRRATHAWRGVAEHAPIERKRRPWRFEDRAAIVRRAARRAESEVELSLSAALSLDPAHREARRLLSETYLAGLREAEARGDDAAATRFSTLLRGADPAGWDVWHSLGASLHLRTDPPGATVTVCRYVERDRQLVPEAVFTAGPTPLVDVKVPPGSLLLRIEHPACGTVHYPIVAQRGETLRVVPPGATEDHVVDLPRCGELGADDVYVPAGWSLVGDPEAADGWPRSRVWVDAFVIRRFPVTNAEYLAFLQERPDALALAPRTGSRALAAAAEFRFVDGRPELGTAHPRFAVVGIPAAAAEAYAAWCAVKTGRPWRLMAEVEFERAARGADGRAFPWGNTFDYSHTNALRTLGRTPRPVPVDDLRRDVSPFGVSGLAGNARAWCRNGYRRTFDTNVPANTTFRAVRGGAFISTAAQCASAARFGGSPSAAIDLVGIRLTAPWVRGPASG